MKKLRQGCHNLLIVCFSIFFSTLALADVSAPQKSNKAKVVANMPASMPMKNNNADNHYLDDQQVHGVTVDAQGTVYVATNQGISSKEKNASTFTSIFEDGARCVNNIVVGTNGIVYAGTSDGFLIGTKDQAGHYRFQLYQDKAFGPQHEISSLFMDKKGRVFIGAHGVFVLGVLHHWFGYPDTYYFSNMGLNSHVITSLSIDSAEAIYVGTQDAGLFMGKSTDPEKYLFDFDHIETSSDPLDKTRIVSLFIDAQDVVYIGTDTGLKAGKIGYDHPINKTDIVSPMLAQDGSSDYASHNRIISSIYVSNTGRIFTGACAGALGESFVFMGNKNKIEKGFTYSLAPMSITEMLNETTTSYTYPFVYLDEATNLLYIGTPHGLLTKNVGSL